MPHRTPLYRCSRRNSCPQNAHIGYWKHETLNAVVKLDPSRQDMATRPLLRAQNNVSFASMGFRLQDCTRSSSASLFPFSLASRLLPVFFCSPDVTSLLLLVNELPFGTPRFDNQSYASVNGAQQKHPVADAPAFKRKTT